MMEEIEIKECTIRRLLEEENTNNINLSGKTSSVHTIYRKM